MKAPTKRDIGLLTANLLEVGDNLWKADDVSVLSSVQRIAKLATLAMVSLVMMVLAGLVCVNGLRSGDTRGLTPDETWSRFASMPFDRCPHDRHEPGLPWIDPVNLSRENLRDAADLSPRSVSS